MNELTTYSNEEFGQLRKVDINGQPWFIARDVAKILGYARPAKAVLDHVDEDDRRVIALDDTLGRKNNANIINESGMFSLILSSKLPSAKQFKRWVTSEILPSIHNTGSFQMGGAMPIPASEQKLLAEAFIKAKELLEQKDVELQEVRPKAKLCEIIIDEKSLQSIRKVAKEVDMRPCDLADKLIDNGYIYRNSNKSYRLFPCKESKEANLFALVGWATYITPKGKQALIQWLRGEIDNMLDYKI